MPKQDKKTPSEISMELARAASKKSADDAAFENRGRPRNPKKQTPRVTPELHQKMYAAYMEEQTATHVSRKTGVSVYVATRYIEHGNPRLGYLAFKDRFRKMQEMTRAQQDYDMLKARNEFQKVARTFFLKMAKRVQEVDPSELAADRLPENLNKLLTVIDRTFGEAEHKVDMKGDFSNWSIEELRHYIEKGITPAK